MTASAGASFHKQVDWHSINWLAVHRTVSRLQARIVKARQEGRWGKVKALQHLLTHSFSARVLAIRRVTENQGKRTAGVDGELWNTPQKKAKAEASLRPRGYKARPLRRIYIPKGPGKKGRRPLGIPTMRDRAMQALYLIALDPNAETTADPNSYGFRRGRSTADAIMQCHIVLAQKKAPQWILECDIKACFDGISHPWLMAHIPMNKVILQQWLKAGYIDKNILYSTESGTPQGGIASPVLMNMALDGLERELRKRFPKTTRKGMKASVNYIRYADDMVITARSRELLEEVVKPLVESFLAKRELELSQEKTKITHIEEGFDFLGFTVRKYSGKLLITPSKKNVKAFLDKIRRIVKGNKQAKASTLIALLNPIIRGWTNYHKHVVSKKTFSYVDNAIFELLWQWAKRRHREKPRQWIINRYFKQEGGRSWIFFGIENSPQGEKRELQLKIAAKVPIKRHHKIKGATNPYDPQWEVYFEKRNQAKMRDNLRGRRKLLRLFNKQEGLCPECQQQLTEARGWHVHHIVERVYGGKDTMDNLVLLHPNCHRKIHSRGSKVAPPRPETGVTEA